MQSKEIFAPINDRPVSETELFGRDIVCFSNDWSGDPLSKTHLMRVLARNNRILWVNAIANRAPTASSKDLARVLKKLRAFTEPIKEVESNIFVLNPLALPSYRNGFLRRYNQSYLSRQVRRAMSQLNFKDVVNMVFNPAAGLLARKLGEKELIYYCVDEYTAFTGASPGLKQIEADLLKKSDLVIVSAERLHETKAPFNRNTFIIRHGTDWRHFRSALDGNTIVPHEIDSLPRPIIGFHGLLADWVDFALIKKIAEHFSGGSLVLLGSTTVDAERKIKILDGVPNIHRLGRKPYTDLPAYCKGFDVAINPFEINELTLAANPLKVREYLAAGLMAVSTDIPEVRELPFCLVGTDHDSFIRKIEEALDSDVSRAKVSDAVSGESWESRITELRQIMLRSRLQTRIGHVSNLG